LLPTPADAKLMHDQDVGQRNELRDWREIAQHVVGHLLVHDVVAGDRAGDHQERVAVGRRFRDQIDADDVAGAAAVLDVELLAHGLRQVRRKQTTERIRHAAGRGRDQHPHRL
jgi:hypothetical protein